MSAQALSGSKKINAEYGEVSLSINGNPFTPVNADGEPDEPFTVNGVVYVAISSVAQTLNASVTWDAKKKTIFLDKDVPALVVINKAPAPAVTVQKLTVQYGSMKLLVNGKRVKFKDKSGKTAEPFKIGETFYCPIRSAEPAAKASKGKTALPNGKSLKKGMTDKEFQQGYAVAAQIAAKYEGMSLEQQLKGIYKDTRHMTETLLTYSTTQKHYNDVYGFYVLNVASCAGATRAVGLCLNILGISYEHMNENKWLHQWCRVKVGEEYWICDAYGMYVGPEPTPYTHPFFS
jgi:hypothetical protein